MGLPRAWHRSAVAEWPEPGISMARWRPAAGSSRTRVGRLFRRASRWQKAMVVVCALVAAHGVPPPCAAPRQRAAVPQAIVAAFAGSGGMEVVDGSPELAERHDAACVADGRQWLLAGLLQVVIATVWGLSVLEWAGVWRRRRQGATRQEVSVLLITRGYSLWTPTPSRVPRVSSSRRVLAARSASWYSRWCWRTMTRSAAARPSSSPAQASSCPFTSQTGT